MKKIIEVSVCIIILFSILVGCNNKEHENIHNGEVNESNQTNVQIDKQSENNGGSFVLYKGKVYFREYSNSDIEKTAVNGQFDFEKTEKHSKYINVISENGKIQNVFKDDGYGDFYILDDRFFFTGYQDKLYSVNLKGEEYREFSKGSYIGCNEQEHIIYYKNYNNENAIYALDTRNLKINRITDESLNETAIKETLCDTESAIKSIEVSSVFSAAEEENLKERYRVGLDDTNYSIHIRECEKVGNKLYFLIDLLKFNEKASDDNEEYYDRVASEGYSYDLTTGKKVLIYLYKVTDKEENESGNIYSSGDNEIVEEPLAENEMYLEINLKNKGLQDTFELRVEEVGGAIIGKRIEYEGTHTRNEESLKVKVTKEVGAMLNVYIDNKLDSQMLIEE